MSQAQDCIHGAVTGNKKEKLTTLLHHVSIDVLRWGFYSLKKRAAPGVDGVTWDQYAVDLEAHLADLHARFARKRSRRDFRLSWNLPLRERPLIKMKPRNLKVSGFHESTLRASVRRMAAKFDQAGLVRMQ